jgi:putative ABC transport system permease protein
VKWFLAMLRESRGSRGRLFFFTVCVAIGVAAVVGVATMASTLRDGLRAQSRDLLAADLVVESRRPIDPEVVKIVTDHGAWATTRVREFATMVAPIDADGNAEHSRLALLKSVDGTFPFYGLFELDPPGSLDDALALGIVVAPELGVQPGQKVRIGNEAMTVAAVVRREPQQIGFMSMLGPRVFVREDALKETGLLGFGSRMRHQLLVHHPGVGLKELAESLRNDAPGADYLRVETWSDGQPRIRRTMARVESYLGLVALLSLVLGGIGVAQIAQAWIASRTPAIAILRCVGMRPKEVLRLFLGQIALLALVGSVVGAVIGSLLPLAFESVSADFFPAGLTSGSLFQPLAIARGIGLGVTIALLFSLPPLTAVWRVSPAKVLRADAAPLPAPRGVQMFAFATLLIGIFVTAWIQSDRWWLAFWFTVGFFALGGLLTLGARLVMIVVGKIPRGALHPYLAQGLSALARPGAGTTGSVVALGLGVMVVASMAIVEKDLASGIRALIPADAPTVFLVDVQPDQWEGVNEELNGNGATSISSAAIVMGRLRAINGRSVREIVKERGGRMRWTLTREQRMAPLDKSAVGDTVVEGRLWSEPDVKEISLETGYAKDMGVSLGDTLTFDVQGVPMDFKLTSLRKVEWRSFSLNFFVAVEPGSLDGAPGFRLAAAKVPPNLEQPLQDRLAETYPNVTMIKLRTVLDLIMAMLEQLAVGVRILGAFTVFAGLAILAGAISAATMHRRREVALLKTLGATRRGVCALFLTEFGLLGALAGLLGAVGAILLAWGFLTGVADLEFEWPFWTLPIATIAAAALAAGCGIFANLPALRAPPRESLRG